jgi:hypothetical protein
LTWDRKNITDKVIKIRELWASPNPPLKRLAWIKIFAGELEEFFKLVDNNPILLYISWGKVYPFWRAGISISIKRWLRLGFCWGSTASASGRYSVLIIEAVKWFEVRFCSLNVHKKWLIGFTIIHKPLIHNLRIKNCIVQKIISMSSIRTERKE